MAQQTEETPQAQEAPTTQGGGFLSRILPRPAAKTTADATTTADGATTQKPATRFGRLGLALAILFIGLNGINYLLAFFNDRFNLNLSHYVTSNHSTPIIGGMSWMELLYFVLVIALYIIIFRFVLPDPFGTKAMAERRALAARTQAKSATSAGGPSNARPSGHGPRTRAARRHAEAVAAANEAAKAQRAQEAKATRRTIFAPKRTATTQASTVTTPAAPAPTAKPSTVKGAATKAATTGSGAYDQAHARAQAARRAQKRRSARR